MKMPSFFIIEVKSLEDIEQARRVLGTLALAPCIVHVNTMLFNQLK